MIAPRQLDPAQVRRVESRASAICDPAEKLRFLRQAQTRCRRSPRHWKTAALLLAVSGGLVLALAGGGTKAAPPPPPRLVRTPPAAAPAAQVWLVERKAGTEFYSNGLRVEGGREAATMPRSYDALRLSGGGFVKRTDPAGIVFHTTESQLAPFEAGHNHALKATGEELLAYVRRHALYHFVIDRFGRVHRVVAESDFANHAGHSVWADREFAYLELNHPFLGVAFEGRTATAESAANRAQTASARLLVEMLRARYPIAEGNCVTHAQVSVNPSNMQIGYHTDWAFGFPYRELGLPDGYETPSPAVTLFGFQYAQDFLHALGGRAWNGLVAAEQQLVKDAAAGGTTMDRYRTQLQRKFRTTLASRRHGAAAAKDPT